MSKPRSEHATLYTYDEADCVHDDIEPTRHLPNYMPPTEFPRMDGETNDKAARRLLDVWEGCHGD